MQIAPSRRAEMEPGDGVAPAAARSKILKSAGEEGPPPPHCKQMSLKKKKEKRKIICGKKISGFCDFIIIGIKMQAKTNLSSFENAGSC